MLGLRAAWRLLELLMGKRYVQWETLVTQGQFYARTTQQGD